MQDLEQFLEESLGSNYSLDVGKLMKRETVMMDKNSDRKFV
jgi:hypothetical protein